MSLVIYGDPHGDWRPLLEAVALELPAAIIILGDCDLGRPLHCELAPIFAAGVEVAYLYGNHEKDLPEFWDNLVGDHPDGLLHARVQAHLEAVHAEAAGMIRDHVAAVSAVADALVTARSLTGAEIAELVARHPPGTAPGDGTP